MLRVGVGWWLDLGCKLCRLVTPRTMAERTEFDTYTKAERCRIQTRIEKWEKGALEASHCRNGLGNDPSFDVTSA